MSILDGLPTLKAAVSIKDERGEHHAVTNMIAWVKRDDVREALTNPEPVMLRPIAAALHQSLDVGRFDLLPPQQQARWMAAAATVLAEAAGVNQ